MKKIGIITSGCGASLDVFQEDAGPVAVRCGVEDDTYACLGDLLGALYTGWEFVPVAAAA